jgi:hypothetical protein
VDDSLFGRINLVKETHNPSNSHPHARNRIFVDGKWVIVEPPAPPRIGPPPAGHRGGHPPPPPSYWPGGPPRPGPPPGPGPRPNIPPIIVLRRERSPSGRRRRPTSTWETIKERMFRKRSLSSSSSFSPPASYRGSPPRPPSPGTLSLTAGPPLPPSTWKTIKKRVFRRRSSSPSSSISLPDD